MTQFKGRGQAFESNFKREQELKFKIVARRNKLLGLWAADLLGKSGDDATAYARDVIRADFEEAGDEDVYRKVKADLGDKTDETTLRSKMVELMARAKAQLLEEN